MKKVLVTGGAGFIGSHLCEGLLARGYRVRALDSLVYGRREDVPAAAEFIQGADFCFIDGGHTFECIKADTENALKVLSPNGVIVWDDYTWFVEGVSRYLRELSKTLPLKRIAGSQFVIYRREG